ncbi:cloacin [Pseudomonas fluorescens]|uniref:Cloacin n=1 Tax=Pseudomonas fluorescens TaxID=294 RepID=A0A1T2Z3C2_PSEFL|nr:colicin E3-like toxin immunity protein [Pseudomonas fluorescens]OPA98353.1 cloacin [Pseudomonas fluorescens]
MAMKIRLRWYEKHSNDLKADEYSVDIDDADSSFEALGLSDETAIYADVFNVLPSWIAILQPHFQHVIAPNLYDYQISFRYQGAWPPPPKQSKKAS